MAAHTLELARLICESSIPRLPTAQSLPAVSVPASRSPPRIKIAGPAAITQAIVDYSDYWEAIMRNANQTCVGHIVSAIKSIDKILDTPLLSTPLKALFGLSGLKHDDDFASVITAPLLTLQNTNWHPDFDRPEWNSFCEKLASGGAEGWFKWIKVPSEMMNYASWIRNNIASQCSNVEEVSTFPHQRGGDRGDFLYINSAGGHTTRRTCRAKKWMTCVHGTFRYEPSILSPHRLGPNPSYLGLHTMGVLQGTLD